MKGQISLDLLMSVLVAIVILGTLFVVAENLRSNYREMFVENQLKKISSESAAFITASRAMEDTNFSSSLKVPSVQHKNKKFTPELKFDGNTLAVSVTIGGREISQSAVFAPSAKHDIEWDKQNRFLEVKKK